MKIAVLVFGIPRASAVTLEPLMRHIVAPARTVGEVGLFGHFFEQTHVSNARSGENASLSAENYKAFRQDFQLITEPPAQCLAAGPFEALKPFGDYYGDGFQSLSNLMHQLHSVECVTALAREQMDPDVYLFARPDLLYHDACPQLLIRRAGLHPSHCYLPPWQWWGGYNDRLAVCGRHAAQAWGHRLRQALPYCEQQQKPLHAEKLLRFALKQGDVSLRLLPVRASRVRVSGDVKDELFDPLKTYSSRKGLLEMGRAWALSHMGR